MENSIRTDHDVKIGKIKFKEGETVGIGQVVIEFVSEQQGFCSLLIFDEIYPAG